MKIRNGFFYIALKDMKFKDRIVFTKGRRYMALKDNALHGDDCELYSFPPNRQLQEYFKED